MFERLEVRKEYLALAEGVIGEAEGVIDLPLTRAAEVNPHVAPMVVAPGGPEARTGFRVVERFDGFTLVRCRLFTGRMHQIRAHLKAVGHPIVCDKVYGARQELWTHDVRALRPGEKDALLLDRQALHAERIEFEHPRSGELLKIEAPLPEDIQRTLAELRKKRKKGTVPFFG